MNSQPIRAINAKTTFALARRIERALRPIIESIDSDADLHIEMGIDSKRYPEPFYVNVSVFRVDDSGALHLPTMVLHIHHTDAIPGLADKLRADLAKSVAEDA